MKILVACEESQAVTKAFRAKGHEAYSCDIEPCSGGHPEWHIQGDAIPLLKQEWDMIIAFPPCTYLTTCANRAFNTKLNPLEKVIQRYKNREDAIRFFMRFINADCNRIAVENPQGCMNTMYRKPDQIVHPYYFAEDVNDESNYYQKKTCLWLKNLPELTRTNNLPKPEPKYISQGEKTKGKAIGWCEGMSGVTGAQKGRAAARSKTFPGIAAAMADQWG